MRDFSDALELTRKRIADAAAYLKIEDLRARRPLLETEASRPDLWDDPEVAKRVTGELSVVIDDLERYERLVGQLEDAETLHELAREVDDESQEPEIEATLTSLDRELRGLELRSMFSGEHDERDALCTIQAGEGGADAQDWAEMLYRMYVRWAERRGFEVEEEGSTPGSEAGVSSVEFLVKGRYAYGYLQAERGRAPSRADEPVQRPGQAADRLRGPRRGAGAPRGRGAGRGRRRPTSRWTSSGPRAPAASTSTRRRSAVRLTHLPTGIVVSCQVERSQFQNRDRAMAMLKARLADLERQKREDELAGIRGEQQRVGFGSQIRSYVMQPYQMVKDLRTEHEAGNVQGVLDGDLDPFMEAYLQWRRATGSS